VIARDDLSARAPSLVTGGLGFLGSHVVRECLRRGRRVRILDDGSSADPNHRREFARDPRVELWHGSVHDAELVRRAVDGAGEAFHLAAIVGVRRVALDPRGVLANNTLGARIVVDRCEAARIPLLFVSSSEVYGAGSLGMPFREEDAPRFDAAAAASDGRAAYALSKWLGEERCRAAARRGLPVVIARPFNAVGSGQSAAGGALVPNLIRAALRGEPLLLEGDGGSTRAFADAEEIASAFLDLLDRPAAHGLAVNVGGRHVHSIAEIAALVDQIIGIRSRVITGARVARGGAGRIAHRSADLSRLRALLGWAPSRPVRGAIERAVERARASLRGPAAVA
jgi:UDP-glucose 4-epimerase